MKFKVIRLWLYKDEEDPEDNEYLQAETKTELYELCFEKYKKILSYMDLQDIPDNLEELEINVEEPVDMANFKQRFDTTQCFFKNDKNGAEAHFDLSEMEWNVCYPGQVIGKFYKVKEVA